MLQKHMIRLAAWLIILSTACVTAPTQEPAPTQDGETSTSTAGERGILRERTVYVPFEKLDDVFESSGRGVFVPYEEFLELWRSHKKTPKPEPKAPPADVVIRGGYYTGEVDGKLARFRVKYFIESLKEGWTEVSLPFRGVAIEKVSFDKKDALFTSQGGRQRLLLPARGRYECEVQFATNLQTSPGRKSLSFTVPPVAVSRIELTIPEKDARVTIQPSEAASKVESSEESTKVDIHLGASSDVGIVWTPPTGVASKEGAVIFADQLVSAFLGERLLRVETRIRLAIERGESSELRIKTPAQLALLKVVGENIRVWRQEGEFLIVSLHSPVKNAYELTLRFERILENTPESIEVPFPSLPDVRRESGWISLSHDPNLKTRIVSARGLSQLDPGEVPPELRSGLRAGFRYLAPPPPLSLAIETILPSIRSRTTSVVTLGSEEDRWVGLVNYTITKAGVFRLELRIPKRWSVVDIGDPAIVEDFQVDQPAATEPMRTITVNLKSRVLGTFQLPFTFTADGSASTTEKTLSPPQVLGSEQDAGLFGVTAPRSLELTTIEQTNMRSTDANELVASNILGRVSSDAPLPLTYSYRENSAGQSASVKLGVKSKRGELHLSSRLLVDVADDRVSFRGYLSYEILYKEVDVLRFTAPQSLDEKLKVESPRQKEAARRTAGAGGLTIWEIPLQAPTIGAVPVTITFEEALDVLPAGQAKDLSIGLIRAGEDVTRERGYVVVSRSGRLDIRATTNDMESIDPEQLPDNTRRGDVHSAYHFYARAPSLTLQLTRFNYETLTTTVVNHLHLKSVLSDQPVKLTTRATLLVRNLDQPNLEVRLSAGAKLYDVWVAGKRETPKLSADGTAHLVPIPRGQTNAFWVSLVYDQPLSLATLGSTGDIAFNAPQIQDGVPVQRTDIDIWVPADLVVLAEGGNAVREWRAPRTFDNAAPDGFDLSTEYLTHHAFGTRSPHANLELEYATDSAYTTLQVVGFLLTAIIGLGLSLRFAQWRLWIAVAIVLLPALLFGSTDSPKADIYFSATLGGALVALLSLANWSRTRFSKWRRERIALAPDPFLEDAGETKGESTADATPKDSEASDDDLNETPENGSSESNGEASDKKDEGSKDD